MARFPHTKLFIEPRRTVVISGPHIQVLDTQDGRVLHSTANVTRENEDVLLNAGFISCSGVDRDARYLATTSDDKRLKIWDLESLTLMSSRELPKKPTSIEFTSSADILVSDKFGDVFRYTLHPNNEVVQEKSVSGALASHENPSGGELILGHASLLTSCLLTPDEKFIVTADRDEHIRISWYPQGYVIESYCLGHTKYVSAIHIPDNLPTSLISGGGDPDLKVWDWMTGRLQRNIAILAVVEPFIRVTAQNKKHEWPQGNDDDDDAVKTGNGKKRGRRGKRRSTPSMEIEDSKAYQFADSESADKPLVVRRIESFVSSGETHVVFSVVGGTAIFEFVLTETEDQPDIHHYEFRKPVIDFTLCGEGLIWALLDADFPEESDMSDEPPRKLVQAIQWSSDHNFVDAGNSALLDSLNTLCSIPATEEELKGLDFYSDLSSLPKSVRGEQESQVDDRLDEPPHDEPEGEDASAPVGLTKRALGRLKHKRALGQLHHEKAEGDGPDTKKTKTDEEEEVHSM